MAYRRAVYSHRWWFAVSMAILVTLASTARFISSACAADPPPAAYKTLAAALADAKPPAGDGVALTVSGEYIKSAPVNESNLPETPLRAGAPVVRVANRFGRLVRHFGAVTALAPPKMVLINTKLGRPNIYDGMPKYDVLTLLLASLSDGQWQAVTSEQGLGVGGLATDDQKMLMSALLPKGKLTVAPYYYRYNPDYKSEEVRDLSDGLSQGRLRINTSFSVLLPSVDKAHTSYSSDDIPPSPGGSAHYRITTELGYDGLKNSYFGVTVRETIGNVEKRGQLPLEDSRLNKTIHLSGIKSVGALFDEIRKITGVEVYSDPRYAILSLTWISGEYASASARDLLRAVAFCCTATYRGVGPETGSAKAYVLTDDIVGMGTRKSIWYEFEQDAAAARTDPVTKAAQSLYSRFGARSVAAFGEEAKLAEPPTPSAGGAKGDIDSTVWVDKPFEQLTSAQQAAIERTIDQHNAAYPGQKAGTSRKIEIFQRVKLELLLPSVETPIDMDLSVPFGSLFRMTKADIDARDAARKAAQAKMFADYIAAHPEKARLAPVARPEIAREAMRTDNPRRAVILSPASTAELADDVAAMQKLQLNELWLDIPFRKRGAMAAATAKQDGVTTASANSAQAVTPEALMAAAIADTQKTDIRVFPIIHIFQEDASSDAELSAVEKAERDNARDRNLLGETSREAEKHRQDRIALVDGDTSQIRSADDGTQPFPGECLSPLANGVLSDTQALVRRLAATPGITGLIWSDTDPPGYDAVRGGEDLNRRLLGYNAAMRLAFLRIAHADPVDIYSPNYYSGMANTDVDVENWEFRITTELNQKWKAYRREQNVAFLRALYADAGSLPVFVHQRRYGRIVNYSDGQRGFQPGWYGSWDGAPATLPTFRNEGDDDNLGKPDRSETAESLGPADVQARRQSQSVRTVVSSADFAYLRSYPPAVIPGRAKPAPRPDDGFVLDFREAVHANPFSPPVKAAQTLAELAAGEQ